MSPLLEEIQIMGQRDLDQIQAESKDPMGDRVNEVRDAFEAGRISEEAYEEMLMGIGAASNEAGF